MAKSQRQPPKEETKAQRFRRVISPRVNKAIKAIGLVGSVKGSTYEHDEKQIAQISAALTDAVDKATSSLSGKGDSAGGFSF